MARYTGIFQVVAKPGVLVVVSGPIQQGVEDSGNAIASAPIGTVVEIENNVDVAVVNDAPGNF